MKQSMKRAVLLAVVIALVGVLAVTAVAFAAGPGTATQSQNGHTYGAGDGTGPIIGGHFGSGPHCPDDDGDGVCNCKE